MDKAGSKSQFRSPKEGEDKLNQTHCEGSLLIGFPQRKSPRKKKKWYPKRASTKKNIFTPGLGHFIIETVREKKKTSKGTCQGKEHRGKVEEYNWFGGGG